MDYEKIGMRIRLFRRKKGLSQEQLAELVDISVPHMSHIETGNTKLSLPVFVAIANALDVRTDELLHDSAPEQYSILRDISGILDGCSTEQARCIADIAKAARTAMDTYL